MTGPAADLTIRRARPYGGDPVDIVVRGGLIDRITGAGRAEAVGEVVDADGRWIGPGLWDAHVHFTQHVSRHRRVDLTGTASAREVLDAARAARSRGWPLQGGFLVGYGFRDVLWPDQATLSDLDQAVADVPAVLISGDLHCGWLNSAAAARLGVAVDRSGLLRETPWIDALHLLDDQGSTPLSAFAEAAEAAASRGVVGVVDFEKADNIAEWADRTAQGVTALRVVAAIWPDRLDRVISAGLRTGDTVDRSGLVSVGPLKVIVDGSLNTRTAWCWESYPGADAADPLAAGVESVRIPDLRALLARARAAGIEAAVHAIGDRANSEVLDVFAALRMRGVIEHAQLVREDDFARFGQLGVVASVQPEHAMDDRDAAEHHWAGRTGRAFAFGSLHRAGARLRLGSDAPVAPLDPWIAISAATARSRDGRSPWHPEQRLPVDVALAASARTTLQTGQPADLVVVDRDPRASDGQELRTMPVSATLLAGRFTWRDL
ncbi:amidohydrolase [Microbacterium sp. No. 7]|uniref:amidohydrolase n=1 Tax=Microbacterium sp. No. 7 TaxID=1714373 RepID=UPI0006D075A4|nr:amidohydrolase family protein [Microbacterium sp. No. 7]ALJ20410.1 hypothetical protein AOA12_11045 [Microbacterium sp. No. 7]